MRSHRVRHVPKPFGYRLSVRHHEKEGNHEFMVHWTVHADKRHQVLAQFAQMPFEAYMKHQGEKIKVFGRWHDFVRLQGWGLVETDDTEALQRWLLQWNSALDIDVAPVVDDEEA